MADRLRNRGFALVESLVALLLVGTALLGVGGLQLASLRGGAHVLELLAAQDHVAAQGETLRALHDLPPGDRAALLGAGEVRGCRGDRRCTPREFAADEAARSAARTARRGWSAVPVLGSGVPDPLRVTLELRRDERRLVLLDVES